MQPLQVLLELARHPPVYRRTVGLFERTWDLIEKRSMLAVAAADLDQVVAEYMQRAVRRIDPNGYITDPLPEIRLKISVEAIPHIIYGMCELAAHLLWIAEGRFPRSFHKIAKACARSSGDPYDAFKAHVGDLTWYFRAREIRTEWTHFSTSFVGGGLDQPPRIVGKAFRGNDAKTIVQGRFEMETGDLREVAMAAIGAVDRIADFVTRARIVPKLDATEATKALRGVRDGRFVIEETTMGQVLRELGLA